MYVMMCIYIYIYIYDIVLRRRSCGLCRGRHPQAPLKIL